jgi:hypothetical protein
LEKFIDDVNKIRSDILRQSQCESDFPFVSIF